MGNIVNSDGNEVTISAGAGIHLIFQDEKWHISENT